MIEGVMMRSPHFIAVAVRKPDRKIVIKNLPYESIVKRIPLLKRPVLRGVTTLLESMIQGMQALSYSANVAISEEELAKNGKPSELSNWAIAGSIVMAVGLGMLLFVGLPHGAAWLLTSSEGSTITANSPIFHLVDGIVKMGVLILYVYAIAQMRDIHRVFQYHGAEHKSIYAFEAGLELTVENARKFTTLHPRCGTSFLLFLVLISVAVFSIVFPVFGLTELTSKAWLNHLLMIVLKIFLMLPVAGLAYEFIRLCAGKMNNPVYRALIWPGMVLQNLTTREPDDEQLEVALASLRQVLLLEKQTLPLATESIEIGALGEIAFVAAGVAEFPET